MASLTIGSLKSSICFASYSFYYWPPNILLRNDCDFIGFGSIFDELLLY